MWLTSDIDVADNSNLQDLLAIGSKCRQPKPIRWKTQYL